MGATLAVPCKSLKATKQLYIFLKSNLRPFSVVSDEATDIRTEFEAWRAANPKTIQHALPTKDIPFDPTAEVFTGKGLDYGASASKVGFNFNTQGQFSIYMHTILAWASLRVGRKRGLNTLSIVGHVDQRVPYYTYDTYDTYDTNPTPVLTEADIAFWDSASQEHARLHWVVDGYGMRIFGDTTHYAEVQWGGAAAAAYLEDETTALWTRDKAIHTIVAREMRRLNVLWYDFMDMEAK